MAMTDLLEALRKENRKRDEAVRCLLSSVATLIKADLEACSHPMI